MTKHKPKKPSLGAQPLEWHFEFSDISEMGRDFCVILANGEEEGDPLLVELKRQFHAGGELFLLFALKTEGTEKLPPFLVNARLLRAIVPANEGREFCLPVGYGRKRRVRKGAIIRDAS